MEESRLRKSLGGIYTSIYDIDLATERYYELSSFNIVRERIGKEGDVREKLEYFVSNMVVPSFIPEIRDFVNLDTLNERMKGKKRICAEYLSPEFLCTTPIKTEQWTRCSFIEGERDEENNLLSVFFTVEAIHSDKIKELEALEKEK